MDTWARHSPNRPALYIRQLICRKATKAHRDVTTAIQTVMPTAAYTAALASYNPSTFCPETFFQSTFNRDTTSDPLNIDTIQAFSLIGHLSEHCLYSTLSTMDDDTLEDTLVATALLNSAKMVSRDSRCRQRAHEPTDPLRYRLRITPSGSVNDKAIFGQNRNNLSTFDRATVVLNAHSARNIALHTEAGTAFEVALTETFTQTSHEHERRTGVAMVNIHRAELAQVFRLHIHTLLLLLAQSDTNDPLHKHLYRNMDSKLYTATQLPYHKAIKTDSQLQNAFARGNKLTLQYSWRDTTLFLFGMAFTTYDFYLNVARLDASLLPFLALCSYQTILPGQCGPTLLTQCGQPLVFEDWTDKQMVAKTDRLLMRRIADLMSGPLGCQFTKILYLFCERDKTKASQFVSILRDFLPGYSVNVTVAEIYLLVDCWRCCWRNQLHCANKALAFATLAITPRHTLPNDLTESILIHHHKLFAGIHRTPVLYPRGRAMWTLADILVEARYYLANHCHATPPKRKHV